MYLEYCYRITSHRYYSYVKKNCMGFHVTGGRRGRDRMVVGFSAISAYQY